MRSSPGSRANNIYSLGSDKLTEVQLYMSSSCQPGSRVIRAFSDNIKLCLFFSDLAALVWPMFLFLNVISAPEGTL